MKRSTSSAIKEAAQPLARGNVLAEDLDHVLAHTASVWDELRGGRLFITGGTGFWGCWLLESLAWANDRLGLGARAVVLTRDARRFRDKAAHLASHRAIELHDGDVRTFEFPPGEFSHIIHAATDASAKLNAERPLSMMETIIDGTRRVLEFARRCGARKVLYASSGAVYGKQPADLLRVGEDYAGAPDPIAPASGYGQAKRTAECLCAIYSSQYGLDVKIARGFAFVGPYLPLDEHFAVGNFISSGLRGRPIQVKGDGTACRSYLYAADLAVWLWTILFRGDPCRPYNVGSEDTIAIAQLAETVAECFDPPPPVSIAARPLPGRPAERYVPSTERARRELDLRETIGLRESIRRTVLWHGIRPRMRQQAGSARPG